MENSQQHSQPPVYLQRWLTAIAERPKNTKKLTVVENGEVIGSLSLFIERNAIGMKQGYNPPWARLGGPWIRDGKTDHERTLIVRRLIRQLPTNVSYYLTLANKFDYGIFLLEGFESDIECNYAITPDRVPTLTDSFSSLTKRHLKQAQRSLIVSTTSPETFVSIYESNLYGRRRKSYAPIEIAHEILNEGLSRGQAKIFAAVRRDTKEIDGAIACLWDDERYYYWMTTRRQPASGQTRPHQGAVKLLLWSAIQDAAQRNLIFDFDGTPTHGAVRLYEGMGGLKTSRYRITRKTTLERWIGRTRGPIKYLLKNTIGQFMTLKLN